MFVCGCGFLVCHFFLVVVLVVFGGWVVFVWVFGCGLCGFFSLVAWGYVGLVWLWV